jgi:hypothetical protein
MTRDVDKIAEKAVASDHVGSGKTASALYALRACVFRTVIEQFYAIGDEFRGKRSRFRIEGFTHRDGVECLTARSQTSKNKELYVMELPLLDVLTRAEVVEPGTLWDGPLRVDKTFEKILRETGSAYPRDGTSSDATYVAFAKRLADRVLDELGEGALTNGDWTDVIDRLETVKPEPAVHAIIANPDSYDIEEAVQTLETDTWGLPSGEVEVGDRIVVWKAKGSGEHRGVVAFAEVIEPVAERDPQPGSEPFYLGDPKEFTRRRFLMSYEVPNGLPLWFGDNDEVDAVLGALSVSRSQGNKLYKVTPEQWSALRDLAGESPKATTVRTATASSAKATGPQKPVLRKVSVEPSRQESYAVSAPRVTKREARRRESLLVDEFVSWASAAKGWECVAYEYRLADGTRLKCDVFVEEENLLIEAKADSSRESIRMAVGQLMDYRRFHGEGVRLAVLVPEEPAADIVRFLETTSTDVVFRDGVAFGGSAVGQSADAADEHRAIASGASRGPSQIEIAKAVYPKNTLAGRGWYYDFRVLPNVPEARLKGYWARASQRFSRVLADYSAGLNSQWISRHYFASKLIMSATLHYNAVSRAQADNLRLVVPYLRYYTILSLCRALALTVPEQEWNDGELLRMSHSKAQNVCSAAVRDLSRPLGEQVEQMVGRLRDQRELLSYGAPSSGDELLVEPADFLHTCQVLAELAQLHSELLERAVEKRAASDHRVLDPKVAESVVQVRVDGVDVSDPEDGYRMNYLARRHPVPANLMFTMTEGHVDDFFGAWLDDEEGNTFDPDEGKQVIFDVP